MSSYAYDGAPPGLSGAYHYGLGSAGFLGSLAPSTGEEGPSPLYQFVVDGGYSAVEVRGFVTSGPSFGTLVIDEYGSFTYTRTVGFTGTDSFTMDRYAASVYIDTVTVYLLIGGGIVIAGDSIGRAFASLDLTVPGAPPPPPTPSVTIRLYSDSYGDVVGAGVGPIKWAFYDSPNFPACLNSPPVDTGTISSADGAGLATLLVSHTTLTSGQVGLLILSDSDGTLSLGDPPNGFIAPVALN